MLSARYVNAPLRALLCLLAVSCGPKEKKRNDAPAALPLPDLTPIAAIDGTKLTGKIEVSDSYLRTFSGGERHLVVRVRNTLKKIVCGVSLDNIELRRAGEIVLTDERSPVAGKLMYLQKGSGPLHNCLRPDEAGHAVVVIDSEIGAVDAFTFTNLRHRVENDAKDPIDVEVSEVGVRGNHVHARVKNASAVPLEIFEPHALVFDRNGHVLGFIYLEFRVDGRREIMSTRLAPGGGIEASFAPQKFSAAHIETIEITVFRGKPE